MSSRAGSPSDPNARTAPGQRLRAERERRGLSDQQVASDLHVDVTTIEAFETGNLTSLGAPVHVKGHLRKYAMLLGLDAEPLLAACETLQAPVPELVPLKTTQRRASFRVNRTAILIVVTIMVAAAVGWVLVGRRAVPMAPATNAAEALPAPVYARRESEPIEDTTQRPSTIPAAGVLRTEVGSDEAREAASAAVRVRMSFASDSWVEIYDTAEQRVFFDIGASGTSRSVSAQPPLRVFLGYVDGVRLELDGREVVVPAEARRGNLAEFSLDARGHVSPRRQR
jgi:cytoskeleton protein RodZ